MQAMNFLTKGQGGANAAGVPLSPLTLLLSAILLAQVLLALALTLGQRDLGASPDSPLLALDQARVDRLKIERAGMDPVVLERQDGRWVIPALAGFPAAEGQVNDLLDRLSSLRRRLPVATSQEGLTRFKVAEEDFEGRVTLADGDEALAVLYLGDSAGFRRQYVRAEGQMAVYEAEIGPADTPAKPGDWADRGWLQQDEREIRRIQLADVTLQREQADDGWRLADASEAEKLDQVQVDDLVRRLAGLTFTSVLGAEDKPEYGQDQPVLDWQLGLASGETLTYRLSALAEPTPDEGGNGTDEAAGAAEPEWYVLKVSEAPYFLKLAAYTVDPLIGTGREDLLVAPDVPETEKTDETAPADPPAAAEGSVTDAERGGDTGALEPEP